MRTPRKRRRGLLRRLAGSIGVLVVVLSLAAAALFAYLRDDRITTLAKEQFARLAGDGYVTNITSASLSFFRNGIAGVKIEGITVRNAQTNMLLLKSGDASFSISIAALLYGKVQLTDLSLFDAEMHLTGSLGQAGTMYQNILGSDGLVDPALISKMLDGAAQVISSRLQANPDLVVKAQNTKLVLGQSGNASEIFVEELSAAKSLSGEFAFEATISTVDWKTNLQGSVGKNQLNGEATSYRASLDPIPFTRSFTPQLPDLTPRSCTGSIGFAVASTLGLTSIDAILKNGNCSFGALGDYAVEATINGNLKRGSGVFEIGRGLVNVNRSVFNFDGAFAPARYTPKPENAGETPRYRYELVFGPSHIDSLDSTGGPLPLLGKIAGTYAPAERRLALDEFTVDAAGSILRGATSVLFTDVTPAIYLALTSDKIPVQDFKRMWPRFAAPSPRRIVMERVNGGIIRNMRLELQLPPGKMGSKTRLERTQLNGSGDFENAEFNTFGDLPPVRDAKGQVKFDGVEVDIKVESGTAVLPSGLQAKLKPSSFFIGNTYKAPIEADLKVALSGSAEAIAEIAAQEPINAFSNQEFLPADISGNASATAEFKLLFAQRDQAAPPPEFKVTVDLTDVAIARAVNGQNISKASGRIRADNVQTNIRLDAELSGIPAKIIITEPQGAPEKRTQDVTLILTDAIRNKLAPGLKTFLTGPVSARIQGKSTDASVELDLTQAALRIVPFNWEKGAGIGAKARFNLTQDATDFSITNLVVSGRGLEGTGKMQISNGALLSADLNNVRLNPVDDFSISLKKDGNTLNAVLGGAQFDARALMKQILPGREPGKKLSGQAIKVGGKFKRLVGFNEEIVLNADIAYAPGGDWALSLNGEFESGGAIDLSRTSGNGGRLVVQTANAGAALRFVDLYKRMIGGTLATDFKLGVNDSLAGPISISNFVVVGEPRLAKLASDQAVGSASLAEATQADLADEKARFELAQGDIILDQGTISIKRGIVRGANVGATVEGVALSATGRMDLRGTFMPARGLNRIVGAIPLLGLFLGSGSKAGLIGITYQLAGDAKNPKVFVNPISMIAPGIFRQIFE